MLVTVIRETLRYCSAIDLAMHFFGTNFPP